MQRRLALLLLMVQAFIFQASSLSCIGGKSVRGLPSISSSSQMNCCDGQVCYSISEDELPERLENIKNPFILPGKTRRARRAVESKHEDIEIGSGNCPLSISTCRSNQTLIFPVSAISVSKKKRVNIFQHQRFAQPVIFSACVDQTCRILSGKCNQVYIPQPLFVYTSNATIDLEFVYLEHGCECELDRMPQADEIEEPIAHYLNGYIQIFRSETKNGTKPGVALQGINLSTVDSSLVGENQDTANDCLNERKTASNAELSKSDKSLAAPTPFEVTTVASPSLTEYQSAISQYLENNNTNPITSNKHMEIDKNISNEVIEQNKNGPKPFEAVNFATASVADSQSQSTPLQHLQNNSTNSVEMTENIEIGVATSIKDTEKNYNISPKPFEVLSVATANVTKSKTYLTISQNFEIRSIEHFSSNELSTIAISSPNTETIQAIDISKTTSKMSQTTLPISKSLENSNENPTKSNEYVTTMSTNIPVASTAQNGSEIHKQMQVLEIPKLPKNPGDPFLPEKGKFNPLSRMLESYKKRKLS